MNRLLSIVLWGILAAIGAFAFATIALKRGESVNAVWLVTAALVIYYFAYRFYSRFIAQRLLQVDPNRATPAWLHNDGMDYVPTNKWVLYGHHLSTGWQKIFHPTPAIGFLAQARRFAEAAASGKILAPAKTIAEMERVAFNNYLDAAVCGFFVVLVVAMCVYAIRISFRALRATQPTAQETPPVPRAEGGAYA